jgi:hypothetical protein
MRPQGFIPAAMLIPVLPPTELSTIASNVVGTLVEIESP